MGASLHGVVRFPDPYFYILVFRESDVFNMKCTLICFYVEIMWIFMGCVPLCQMYSFWNVPYMWSVPICQMYLYMKCIFLSIVPLYQIIFYQILIIDLDKIAFRRDFFINKLLDLKSNILSLNYVNLNRYIF